MILVDINAVMVSTCSSFRNCVGLNRILVPAVLANSGGTDKRNTMNNERKFYRSESGVCWLITMCMDHGPPRPLT